MKGSIHFRTLAEFKRKAEVGVFVKGGYFFRNELPNEIREITGKHSGSITIRTERGGQVVGSYFYFPKAKDCEIEDNTVLKVYEDRARVENSDVPAEVSWLKYELERGRIKESEIERYRSQVAEYRLYEK